jgi:hypothetical protein
VIELGRAAAASRCAALFDGHCSAGVGGGTAAAGIAEAGIAEAGIAEAGIAEASVL